MASRLRLKRSASRKLVPNMFDVRDKQDRQAKGDREIFTGAEPSDALALLNTNPMDSDESRAELRRLLEWWYYEKDKQAANRMEMAMDADMYDNIQWDPEDAAVLRERGQVPLVFNEVAPMIDWIIGTERRTRVDWRIMPRTEDDVE